jgi:DNA-binding CsgD family transcriptional regulator
MIVRTAIFVMIAFAAGFASLVTGLLLSGNRSTKDLARSWLLVLAAMEAFLFMFAFLILTEAFPTAVSVGFRKAIGASLFSAALGTLAWSAPRFLWVFLRWKPTRAHKNVHRVYFTVTVVLCLLNMVLTLISATDQIFFDDAMKIVLIGVLYVLLLYIVGFCIVLAPTVRDPYLKKSVHVFLIGSAVFFPFIVLDFFGFSVNPFVPVLPTYLLLLSVGAFFFTLRLMRKERIFFDLESAVKDFGKSFDLTEREREVLFLYMDGSSASEIARRLFISRRTAETHIYRIYQKAGVANRMEIFRLLAADAAPLTDTRR